MQIFESSSVNEKLLYLSPKLIRQGHISQVTQKSGTDTEGSKGKPAAGLGGNDTSDSESVSRDISGRGSGDVFDNFFDD